MPSSIDSTSPYYRYYCEKLWEMIPAVYREADLKASPSGVLRALVEVVARQFAESRLSHDRLWDDQFIEFCSDWAVPYIADLVGTRLVSEHDERARRIDVANTIYYRRGKGTLRVLEELATGITGWEGVVVEGFRRLARTRHGLDAEPISLAGPLTRTLPGGWADLRDPHGAELAGKPFDEYFHTADMRQHCGSRGRHGIPKVLFHLYRLPVYRVECGAAGEVVRDGQRLFTFDPSGREVPLFSPRDRELTCHWDKWRPASERELPAPLTRSRLAREMTRGAEPDTAAPQPWGKWLEVGDVQAGEVAIGTLPCATPAASGVRLVVDPERGLFQFVGEPPAGPVSVTYHYASPGTIGAGPYPPTQTGESGPKPKDVEDLVLSALPGSGTVVVSGSGRCSAGPTSETTVSGLALKAESGSRPYIDIGDRWTITGVEKPGKGGVQGTSDAELEIEGLWIRGAELVLAGDFEAVRLKHVTLEPGGAGIPPLRLVVSGYVESLLVESSVVGPITVGPGGSLERLEVVDSVVQSVESDRPAVATGGAVDIERTTILGALRCDELNASEALLVGEGEVANTQVGCFRFSVAMGRVLFSVAAGNMLRLDNEKVGTALKSEFRKHGIALSSRTMVWVQDPGRNWLIADIGQRRSYNIVNNGVGLDVFEGFRLPRPYEAHFYPDAVRFLVSRDFGQPGYARISQLAPEALRRGAENGSEVGAFSGLAESIKLDSLRAKLDEYMPFGLVPVIVLET